MNGQKGGVAGAVHNTMVAHAACWRTPPLCRRRYVVHGRRQHSMYLYCSAPLCCSPSSLATHAACWVAAAHEKHAVILTSLTDHAGRVPVASLVQLVDGDAGLVVIDIIVLLCHVNGRPAKDIVER